MIKPKELADKTVWVVRDGYEYVAILGLSGRIVGRNKFKSTLLSQMQKQSRTLGILAIAPVIPPDKRVLSRRPNRRQRTWNPT
jgi:hypothetical protein